VLKGAPEKTVNLPCFPKEDNRGDAETLDTLKERRPERHREMGVAGKKECRANINKVGHHCEPRRIDLTGKRGKGCQCWSFLKKEYPNGGLRVKHSIGSRE